MHMQRAQLLKLLNNEADVELLIRLMHVKQKKEQLTDDSTENTESVTTDYLQVMLGNQATLKTDLARLMDELNTLTASQVK